MYALIFSSTLRYGAVRLGTVRYAVSTARLGTVRVRHKNAVFTGYIKFHVDSYLCKLINSKSNKS